MCMRVRVYASGHFRSTLLTLSLLPNALRWWHLEAVRDTHRESQPPPPFPPSSTSGPHDNTGQAPLPNP